MSQSRPSVANQRDSTVHFGPGRCLLLLLLLLLLLNVKAQQSVARTTRMSLCEAPQPAIK
jgi:hypothetical protein